MDSLDTSEQRPGPGPIAIFGSGEAAASSRQVHERLMTPLRRPVDVALIETPAGFQPNVDVVSAKITAYLEHHLQNFRPRVTPIRARKRGTANDPDSPEVAKPLLTADYIIAGPGGPTYAIRQLRDSLTLRLLRQRHREGATLALASAAALALSAYTLPVYEIFKVGDDPHWVDGLNLFGDYGLDLVVIPHWNNREGGKDLDTSRCFMGEERFDELLRLLPPSMPILGVDEHTACVIVSRTDTCEVYGTGAVTVLSRGVTTTHDAGTTFPIGDLRLA